MKSFPRCFHKFPKSVTIGLLFAFFAGGFSAPIVHAEDGLFGDFLDAPVFFEMFWQDYYDSTNLQLMLEGKIDPDPFGIRDISHFTWADSQTVKGDREYSRWIWIEKMIYLIPFIKSTDPVHRELLRDWFDGWYAEHRNLKSPNKAAWELMTTGIRSMIFTYYLKQIKLEAASRSHHDDQGEEEQLLISRLLATLLDHQQYLSMPDNFDSNSNHGMWEAIGLFESTRVFPGDQIRKLALERLLLIIEKSLSEQGIHMEHSVSYHYHFMGWLQKYIVYLASLEGFSWDSMKSLEQRQQAMLHAAYFLQDHEGNLPAIGDTDRGKVPDRFRLETTSDEDGLCFDKEAGYAIFKDPAESGLRRYVVFNIQNRPPQLWYHYHNDALAVYFNCGGEVILGDQGKYEYGRSPERDYFTSNLAHNTVVPAVVIDSTKNAKTHYVSSRLLCVKKPAWEDRGNAMELTAGLSYNLSNVRRRILIPKNELLLEVTDSITGKDPLVVLWHIGHDVVRVEAGEVMHKSSGEDTCFAWTLVTGNGKRYSMSISVSEHRDEAVFSIDMYKGSESPMLGWYSPTYLVKVPITLIAVRIRSMHGRSVNVVTRLSAIE
jgi:hypothetical protein